MGLEFLDKMGTDLTTVNTARASFDKWQTEFDEERDPKLIKYLAKHDHWTPAAHIQVQCRVQVPIFIARQWMKSTVGAVYNEVSRRYVDADVEIWFPESWRARPTNGAKQGSSDVLPLDVQEVATNMYKKQTDDAMSTYEQLLMIGVCPEQARAVLPQGMITTFIVTGSLVYWARVYNLRVEGTAQKEWQGLCKQIDGIMNEHFPITWKAETV